MIEIIKIFSYKNKSGYLAILTLYKNDIYNKLKEKKDKIKNELEKKLKDKVDFKIIFIDLNNTNNNENKEDDITIILNSDVFLYPYKLAYLNINKLKITEIEEII